MKTRYLLILALCLGATLTRANNVQINNVTILNNGPGNIQVQFDVSWDNSWRTNVGPNNYDGVWVFFKYKTATGNWTHMTMTGNNNVIPTGFDAYQTNDFLKTGAMLYRESTNMGTGSVTLTGVRLGVISTLPYDITVRGYAIEMVFVPAPTTRPFFGDGDGTTESPFAFHYTDNTATTGSVVPMKVDSVSNTFDNSDLYRGGLYVYSNDTIQQASPLGSLDPFPTMKALWCMKYEINQATYRDFLNTLTYSQQDSMTVNAPNSVAGTGALGTTGLNRNAIEIKTPGVLATTPAVYGCDGNNNNVWDEAGDGEWIACGFLLWFNVASYLDWAGLAPMSELQFERICRGSTSAGPQPAIMGEYAWGTDSTAIVSYTMTSAGTASEAISNASTGAGNSFNASSFSSGPGRSGIFATAGSSRISSGAAFYGVMEMSGNLEEYVITIGTDAGKSVRFIPNGNGNISANGFAQLSVGGAGFWPGMERNTNNATPNTCSGTCEVTGNAGIVLKGGSYAQVVASMPIANRSYFSPTARSGGRGGRGVLYIR
jgi:formylglycine-generating enzyme required for sulfatase activity